MKKLLIVFLTLFLSAAVWPALMRGEEDAPAIPAGSSLQIRLTSTLNSRTNVNGDLWTGNVVEPIIARGGEAVPAGSTVEGRVTLVKPPGRAKGVAEMRLAVDKITTPDGVEFVVSAGLEDAQGPEGTKVGEEGTIKGPGKSTKGAAVETGVGAGVGAGAGAIAHGGSGALDGMAIGAAAGIIHSILKHHKDIVLAQGTELTFMVNRTVSGKRAPLPADAQKQ